MAAKPKDAKTQDVPFRDMTVAERAELRKMLRDEEVSLLDLQADLFGFRKEDDLADNLRLLAIVDRRLSLEFQIKLIRLGIEGYPDDDTVQELSENDRVGLCMFAIGHHFLGNAMDKKK